MTRYKPLEMVGVNMVELGGTVVRLAIDSIVMQQPRLSKSRVTMTELEAAVIAFWIVMGQRADDRFETLVAHYKKQFAAQVADIPSARSKREGQKE